MSPLLATIAAIIALISSVGSAVMQMWFGIHNRRLLREVNLWQTGAVGTFVAIAVATSYLLAIIGKKADFGDNLLAWTIPLAMVSLSLGTYWSIQTARYVALQQSLVQQKMDFISVATHEIGTPLTSILGYCDLLRTFEHPPEVDNLIDGLVAGTARLRVVKRYNDALQKTSEFSPVNLCELIEGVINMRETWTATRKQLGELPISLDCPDYVVEVDRDKFTTAVMIMVSNAIKAAKTAVFVEAVVQSKQVIVRVRDDGSGVEESDLLRLFEPMTQLDISSTRMFEGFGMGLYVLAQIVRAHQGDKTFMSNNQGTTVEIALPTRQL